MQKRYFFSLSCYIHNTWIYTSWLYLAFMAQNSIILCLMANACITHQEAPANIANFPTQPFRDTSDVKKLKCPLQGHKHLGRKSQQIPAHPLCCLPCAMPYNSLGASFFPGLLPALQVNANSACSLLFPLSFIP